MPNCLNCNTSFSEEQKFCWNCSQKTNIAPLSFWTIVKDFFSNLFNLDNRIWQTLKDIWIPGKLTKAYIEGKRTQYYHPLRIFLVVLFAFFTIFIIRLSDGLDEISSYTKEQKQLVWREDLQVKFDSLKILTTLDSIALNDFEFDLFYEKPSILEGYDIINLNRESKEILEDLIVEREITDSIKIVGLIDSLNDAEPTSLISYSVADEEPSSSKTKSSKKQSNSNNIDIFGIDITELYRLSEREAREKYGKGIWYKELFFGQTHKIINNLDSSITFILGNGTWNIVAIILMMALFFKLLYFRRPYLFAEHFIFHVYGHTRLLLMAIIGMLVLRYIIEAYWVFIWFFAGLFYLYKGMRKFYMQSRSKTVVKFILVNMAYFFFLSICSIVVMSISFFFL